MPMPTELGYAIWFLVGICVGAIIMTVIDHREKPTKSSAISPRWRMRGADDEVYPTAPTITKADLDGDIFAPGVLEEATQRWIETPPDKRTHISMSNQSSYFTSPEDFERWMARNGTASGLPSIKFEPSVTSETPPPSKISHTFGEAMADFIRHNSKDGDA